MQSANNPSPYHIYDPRAHTVHRDIPLPSAYDPDAHVVHTLAPPAAYVPLRHASHSFKPIALEAYPFSHGLQTPSPASYVPLLQYVPDVPSTQQHNNNKKKSSRLHRCALK
jgi:hypothetical protein